MAKNDDLSKFYAGLGRLADERRKKANEWSDSLGKPDAEYVIIDADGPEIAVGIWKRVSEDPGELEFDLIEVRRLPNGYWDPSGVRIITQAMLSAYNKAASKKPAKKGADHG